MDVITSSMKRYELRLVGAGRYMTLGNIINHSKLYS